ncbi:MAG: hypothetical protein KDA80_05510 [Planctomycetaceae bacterium]|nr:hypothetical protein [Planctomycetaceae bacterium]
MSGTLLIDGKPVSDVEVHFLNPEFPNHGSFGVTDEDGNFRLVQGAVPGQNTVFFSKINAAGMDMDPESGMDAGQFAAMSTGNEQNPNVKKMEISQLIPPEYSSSNSKLTFSVPDGGTSAAKFEL